MEFAGCCLPFPGREGLPPPHLCFSSAFPSLSSCTATLLPGGPSEALPASTTCHHPCPLPPSHPSPCCPFWEWEENSLSLFLLPCCHLYTTLPCLPMPFCLGWAVLPPACLPPCPSLSLPLPGFVDSWVVGQLVCMPSVDKVWTRQGETGKDRTCVLCLVPATCTWCLVNPLRHAWHGTGGAAARLPFSLSPNTRLPHPPTSSFLPSLFCHERRHGFGQLDSAFLTVMCPHAHHASAPKTPHLPLYGSDKDWMDCCLCRQKQAWQAGTPPLHPFMTVAAELPPLLLNLISQGQETPSPPSGAARQAALRARSLLAPASSALHACTCTH